MGIASWDEELLDNLWCKQWATDVEGKAEVRPRGTDGYQSPLNWNNDDDNNDRSYYFYSIY